MAAAVRTVRAQGRFSSADIGLPGALKGAALGPAAMPSLASEA